MRCSARPPSRSSGIYAAFNQGIEQPDIGLQVRNAQPGFDINGWEVNFMSRYELAAGGTLHVGVENLFNEEYKTLYGQLLRSSSNQSHIPARGATLRVGYTYEW